MTDTPFQVDIDPTDSNALHDLALIRPAQIESEMVAHPAAFAFWNEKLVQAQHELAKAKHEQHVLDARLYLGYRSELESMGAKFTEKVLASKVATDQQKVEADLNVLRCEAEKKRIENVVDTIKTKGRMLTDIGMRINAEIKSNPLTAAQAGNDRAFANA